MADAPEVTVVDCTNKLGGIDLVKHSLLQQDFDLGKVELLLNDDFYGLRAQRVAEYLQDVPFAWRHFPPGNKQTFNLAHKFNQCLMLAEGELIVPLEDYEWADPAWLRTHYDVWKEKGPDVTVHGVTHNCAMPESKFGDHIQDVREILLPEKRVPHALLTVFPGEGLREVKVQVEEHDDRWRKMGVEPGQLLPRATTHVYRNVSLPLERFLEINGYDEGFDGDDPHDFQIDPTAEVYWRAEMQGHRFQYTEEGPLYHLDHWALFKWDRQANYTYMRWKLHTVRNRILTTVALNSDRPTLKTVREVNWRTSRARRLLTGRVEDHCHFDVEEEGETDAAITARVYRRAREHLQGADRILDMGCGCGSGMVDMPQAVGIDICPGALREARERGLEVVLGDVRNLPFKNEAFTGILSIETLEHLLEGEKYMEEAVRVLDPAGQLVLSTPDGGPAVGSHLRMYTRKELVELVRQFMTPLHLEVVPWREREGRENKLLLRAVRRS